MKKNTFIFFVFNSILSWVCCSSAFGQTLSFNYTGATQTWIVPPCVTTITVTVDGAQGGGSAGGLGSSIKGVLSVTPGQVLALNVGGTGGVPAAGWNGGGEGQNATGVNNGSYGGGGASDIRVAPYGLSNRLIVAAGGGGMGGGDTDALAGDGGCNTGVDGTNPFGEGGFGGTQTSGGAGGPAWISSGNIGQNGVLGIGGLGALDPCYNMGPGGGGGGGYYGGGGGGSDCFGSPPLGGGGGGGGSSFVPTGATCTPASNSGNGEITITMGLNTLLTTISSTDAFCNGGTGTATVTPTGGTSPYTYVWSPAGGNSSVATLLAGNYSVTVTEANGCAVTQTVTITEPAPMTLIANVNFATCGLFDGSATVTPSGGITPYTFLWLTSPTVQTTSIAINLGVGTYTVYVTDANGCLQGQTAVVGGNKPPIADFNFSPDIISLLDSVVAFSDVSIGAVSYWAWDFDDIGSAPNDSSSLQNPTHSYSDTGTYCVSLKVWNESLTCFDSITKCLKVEPLVTFFLPNAFTPNKDGKNDIFIGFGSYITEFDMKIFDRLGHLVFESNDIEKGWNGSVNNDADVVQEGVYAWKVRIVDTKEMEYNYVGHVTLIK